MCERKDKLKATLSFTFTFPLFPCTFPLFPFPLSFPLHVEHVESDALHSSHAPALILPVDALATCMLTFGLHLNSRIRLLVNFVLVFRDNPPDSGISSFGHILLRFASAGSCRSTTFKGFRRFSSCSNTFFVAATFVSVSFAFCGRSRMVTGAALPLASQDNELGLFVWRRNHHTHSVLTRLFVTKLQYIPSASVCDIS